MLKFALKLALLAAAAAPISGLAGTAEASEKERRFFQSVEGSWSGPGEIVAGKYKGTKFVCNFDGGTPDKKIGMALDGSCRVGVFTQPMKASVVRGKGGYIGTFLDGAAGKGLDVTGGKVIGNDVVFALHRSSLSGAMRARISDNNTMHITISVQVNDDMVPVIGMKLKRTDSGGIEAIARQ
ncbi:hypothetical protein [Nitratireductor aquibiodomus]|uniref:Uncharacterized protein n=1 Tax=Nitratireductor aquibiodomus TaxID=204799 RepID=A0A1H4IW54_9HYPH|nr:hypothetical protein [Nitratireductor aquibiodomus]SEB37462.1 hypothetical protein SAMN05216452_0563 [Nitratireductor aquibiodomus]